jgi:hypothetical protein
MSVGSRRAYVEWARRQEKEGGKRAAWIEYRSVVGLWVAKPVRISFWFHKRWQQLSASAQSRRLITFLIFTFQKT